MQQTQNYKLNLLETSDTFSPQPLNENAQTVDAALADVTGRVTMLEAKKIVVGNYVGTGQQETITLGFTPFAVLLADRDINGYDARLLVKDHPLHYRNLTQAAIIVEGGFRLDYVNMLNNSGCTFNFIAFG